MATVNCRRCRFEANAGLVRCFSLALTTLTLATCTGADPSSKTVERDSLGVTIIESASPAWVESEGWRVEDEPVLDLSASGTGEPHEFHRVSDMATLADGSIAVAMPSEVRFFTPSGSHIGSVGRDGEGPGEFRRLTDVDPLPGDSVMAFDYWLRRVTVYGPRRALARTFSLNLTLADQKVHPVDGRALLAASEWPSWAREDAEAGSVRAHKALILLSSSGELVDTLAVVAGTESVLLPAEEGWSDARPLFGKGSHVAVADDRIVVGTADFMGYRVLDLEGRATAIVRAPGYDLTLSATLLDAERAARMEVNPSPAMKEHLDQLPTPERRPAYSNLLVDATSAVWVEEHRGEILNFMSPAARRWEVFDPDGAWLGTVELPGRFTVHEINADYLLGVRRDELDIERPQMLAVTR